MEVRRLIRLLLASLAGIATIGTLALAETPSGMGAAAYARRGIDARPAGMGGAFVAVAEGGPAAYYNPAGLAGVPQLNVSGMYTQPFGPDLGISFQYLGVSGPLGTQSPSLLAGLGVALTWLGLQVSGIPISDDEGSGGTFSSDSSLYLVSAGYPLPVPMDASVGMSLKYYQERILEGRADGIGLDLGVLLAFSLGDITVRAGVNAMDIGRTKLSWHGTIGEPENFVPWVNKIGLSAGLFNGMLLIACDLDWAVDRTAREQNVHVGLEFQPTEALLLRGGWSSDFEGTMALSGGVGIRFLNFITVDYAYSLAKSLGGAHLVSAEFHF